MAKIPKIRDSRLARLSEILSIGIKGFPAMAAGSPFMAIATRSEIAINTTKTMPSNTDHFPALVFGILIIYLVIIIFLTIRLHQTYNAFSS